MVCLSVASAVALGNWVRDAYRFHDDVAGCAGVKEVGPLLENVAKKFGGEVEK